MKNLVIIIFVLFCCTSLSAQPKAQKFVPNLFESLKFKNEIKESFFKPLAADCTADYQCQTGFCSVVNGFPGGKCTYDCMYGDSKCPNTDIYSCLTTMQKDLYTDSEYRYSCLPRKNTECDFSSPWIGARTVFLETLEDGHFWSVNHYACGKGGFYNKTQYYSEYGISKEYGESCSNHYECLTGHCSNSDPEFGICTYECSEIWTLEDGCPGGLKCRPTDTNSSTEYEDFTFSCLPKLYEGWACQDPDFHQGAYFFTVIGCPGEDPDGPFVECGFKGARMYCQDDGNWDYVSHCIDEEITGDYIDNDCDYNVE